jgi:hypothetical protein
VPAEVSFLVATLLCIEKLHLFLAGLAVLLGVYYSVKGYQEQFEAKVLQYCHSSHK